MKTFKSPPPIYTTDSDNPTTCPECGSRTNLIAEISNTEQHHKCLKCNYEFILILDYSDEEEYGREPEDFRDFSFKY